MTDGERDNQIIADALLGKDMEAYYKLDASMYPESKPKKYSYGPPPAVTEQPRYKALHSEACDKQVIANRLGSLLREVIGTRKYWLDRSKDKLYFADNEETRRYYGRLAAAVGAVLAEVMTKQRKYEADVAVCREQMAAIEREYYESRPEVFGRKEGGHL